MRFYRPELDALRFFAFICVFSAHAPIEGRWAKPIRDMGNFGMAVFFVLSAYLIVSLLLREKEIQRVDIKAFAIRRVLRIWPLYFLVIGICYALGRVWHGAGGPGSAVAAFSLLAGNWYILRYGWLHSPLDPLWSISVEEQFYVGIPLVSRVASERTLRNVFIGTILLSYLVLYRLGRVTPSPQVWTNSFVQFQFFGAGGLIALFLFRRELHLSRAPRIILAVAGILLWVVAQRCNLISFEPRDASTLMLGYFSVLLGTAVLFIAILGQKAQVPKIVVYLGKISYGLYVFHELIFWTVFDRLHCQHKGLGTLFVLAATIGIAAMSYEFFEKPILRLKNRFETIQTRTL
jgi:peptidoglycan/LPS O-acetylase OafA/YrhL